MSPFALEALIFSPVPLILGPLWAFLAWDRRRTLRWLQDQSTLELP